MTQQRKKQPRFVPVNHGNQQWLCLVCGDVVAAPTEDSPIPIKDRTFYTMCPKCVERSLKNRGE